MTVYKICFENSGFKVDLSVEEYYKEGTEKENLICMLEDPCDMYEKPDVIGIFSTIEKVREYLDKTYELRKGYFGLSYWEIPGPGYAPPTRPSHNRLQIRIVTLNQGIYDR